MKLLKYVFYILEKGVNLQCLNGINFIRFCDIFFQIEIFLYIFNLTTLEYKQRDRE